MTDQDDQPTTNDNRPRDPARRRFLQSVGAAGLSGAAASVLPMAAGAKGSPDQAAPASGHPGPNTRIDHRIAIDTAPIELAKDRVVSTIAYNGQAPGPLLRVREGQPVNIRVDNHLDRPDIVHWHGLLNSVAMDGTPEEGSPIIAPGGSTIYSFTPRPSGIHFYHTHMRAGDDLSTGMYSGQQGVIYIEPKHEPGDYDQEVFLTLHEFEPYFTLDVSEEEEEEEAGGENAPLKGKAPPGNGKPNGFEVGYRLFAINGKMLGFGAPVRVREGQRVIFRIVNASATETRQLVLPGHRFKVLALDGRPVPNPQSVETLTLGTGERVTASVEMTHPGVWILGALNDDDRQRGMGIVVEYANKSGDPQWKAPNHTKWDYTAFGHSPNQNRPPVDDTITLRFDKINRGHGKFNLWPVNHKVFDRGNPRIPIHAGKRYRLVFQNYTGDPHPLHLHRHVFELTKINGKPTAGVMKDVVQIPPFGVIEAEFVADNPFPSGPVLFHCHHQIHLDYGFAALLEYAGGSVYKQGKATL